MDVCYFMPVCSCNGSDESFRLSVMLALSVTANGAKGETLVQMETLLGGDIPMETLNEYLYSYIKTLPSEKPSKLNIANSVWFRDNGFTAEKTFFAEKRGLLRCCGIQIAVRWENAAGYQQPGKEEYRRQDRESHR